MFIRKPTAEGKLSSHLYANRNRPTQTSATKKMLCIPNCCRNANQKDNGKSNCNTQNGNVTSLQAINVEDSLGKKNPVGFWWEYILATHLGMGIF